MAGKQRYTKDQVEEALRSSRGLVTVAARKLGCYPNTVRNYCGRYESVAQAIEDSRESFLDVTELKLAEAVEKKGDMRAIIFVLETLGKNRGYVKRTENEVTGKDGGRIEVDMVARLEQLWDRPLRPDDRDIPNQP